MSNLGAFASGFQSWRRMLGNMQSVEERANVFANCAIEVATWVSKGLDRITAADELQAIAVGCGIDVEIGNDEVQAVIAYAFENIEVVPDLEEEKSNGKGANRGKTSAIRILTEAEFMRGFVPPDYLIGGILQRRFVYSLTGQTGHAKTAIALFIAEAVASVERRWLGTHEVAKGRVLYFVGENPDDVRMRVIGGNSMRADDPRMDQMYFIPGQFKIGEMMMVLKEQVARIGDFALVIVDTSAAYFLGVDENANPQMGAHARMLRALTMLPGTPSILVLCHPIKYVQEPEQLLPRGGGAFLAEMDGNLTAWKSDDLVTLHHGKMRGPGFEPITFKLESVRTPKLADAAGRELPTVRAVPVSRSEEQEKEGQSHEDEDRLLAALLEAPEATYADLAEHCQWFYGTGNEPAKSKVQRVERRLLAETKPTLVKKSRGRIVLTEEGKKVAREAALRLQRTATARTQQPEMF